MSCVEDKLEQWWHKACGSDQPIPEMEPIPESLDGYGLRVKRNTTGLNSNAVTPGDARLHSQISVLLSHHQRRLLLQQMGTDAETHGQTTAEGERPQNSQPIKCLPSRPKEPVEEEAERESEPEG